MRRTMISWSLYRDLRETVHAEDDEIVLHVRTTRLTPGHMHRPRITLVQDEDGFALIMPRTIGRLLAKRLNECLDGTTRVAMRERRRRSA